MSSGDKRQKSLEKQRRQNCRDIVLSGEAVARFDWRNCEALRLFWLFFGRDNVTTVEMIPIAQVCGYEYGIPFPRLAQRRKCALLMWCNDHIDQLRELMNRIEIEYDLEETSD